MVFPQQAAAGCIWGVSFIRSASGANCFKQDFAAWLEKTIICLQFSFQRDELKYLLLTEAKYYLQGQFLSCSGNFQRNCQICPCKALTDGFVSVPQAAGSCVCPHSEQGAVTGVPMSPTTACFAITSGRHNVY